MFEQVTENTFAIADGSTVGNVGLIASSSGNFLIDTSMYPKVARSIRKSQEIIKSGRLVGGVFTHYHFDHTGGAQEFHDIPLYGHQLEKENFEKNYLKDDFISRVQSQDKEGNFHDLKPTLPSRVFSSNPFMPEEDEKIRFLHTGGHTSGSVLIHFEPDHVIFAGDNLFVGRYPWGGDPTASPYDWKEAMEIILSIKPKWIIPGHGSPIEDLKVITDYKDYIERVISTGETLKAEGTDIEKALEELSDLEFLPEAREGMKQSTLKQWLAVIYQL